MKYGIRQRSRYMRCLREKDYAIFLGKALLSQSISGLYFVQFTRFKERVFIPDESLRNDFRKFVKTREEREYDLTNLTAHSSSLHRVLQECECMFHGMTNVPESVWLLFKCISSTSPVSSYYPVMKTLDEITTLMSSGVIIREHPKELLALQQCAPIIYGVVKALPPQPLSANWLQLFKELKEKANATFRLSQHSLERPLEVEGDWDKAFFPAWRRLCQRGYYEKDELRGSRRGQCSKAYTGHPNLSAGIFTMYCEHGKFATFYAVLP